MAKKKVAQRVSVSDIQRAVARLQQQHEWQRPAVVRDGVSSICHEFVQERLSLIAEALQTLSVASAGGGAS